MTDGAVQPEAPTLQEQIEWATSEYNTAVANGLIGRARIIGRRLDALEARAASQERPQPDHDINCGIDALHLGEDIGCTCYVRSESTPAEALDVERLALVLVKRGPHDIIEDWQRGEGPNATDVAELIAAEYARLSPHNREADR
jgi:hypothetical protein